MDTNEIGNRLVALRGNKGQAEVAKALEISNSALSMYERGERMPRDEVKLRIAKYYGKTVQEIFFANQ